MIEFWNTQMGRKFIEGTMPEIGRQLKRLADIMEKSYEDRKRYDIAERRSEMEEFDLGAIHDWALWCLGENESILDSIDTDSATYAAGVLAVCDKVVGADSVVTHQLYAQMNTDKDKKTEDHWYYEEDDDGEQESEVDEDHD